MMITRISRIASRHRMPILKALLYEAFIRSYRNFIFRSVARRFYKSSTPINWFFVAGCYNAGTTIIKDVIALHPNVKTLPIEGDILTSHLSNYEEGGWSRFMYGNREKIFGDRKNGSVNTKELIKDWAPWIVEDKYFLDKSISHSCRLCHIVRDVAGSKIIIVTRNPESVVSGIQKRSRPLGAARKALGMGKYSNEMLLRQWSYLYRTMLEDTDESQTLIVSYEYMLKDPVKTAAYIYKYLGLLPQKASLREDMLTIAGNQLKVFNKNSSPDTYLLTREDITAQISRIEQQYPEPVS